MTILSFQNWQDVLTPSLCILKEKAPYDVQKVDVWQDFANATINLSVTYRLFLMSEFRDRPVHTLVDSFSERLHHILQIKSKTPKQLTVERRRMLWRGEVARKAKAKKRG